KERIKFVFNPVHFIETQLQKLEQLQVSFLENTNNKLIASQLSSLLQRINELLLKMNDMQLNFSEPRGKIAKVQIPLIKLPIKMAMITTRTFHKIMAKIEKIKKNVEHSVDKRIFLQGMKHVG